MDERKYTEVEQWVKDHVKYECRGYFIHPMFLENNLKDLQEKILNPQSEPQKINF